MPGKNHSFFCDHCNQEVVGTPKFHKQTLFHRQNRRIKSLLKKPCISYEEIASRLGVTRERVRQIYEWLLGGDGMERRRTCSINKGPYPLAENCLAMQLKKECDRRGLEFALIRQNPGRFRPKFYSRMAKVCGKVCVLRTTGRRGGNIILHRPEAQADFLLAVLDDGRWMIIPKDKWPSHQTEFAEKVMSTRAGAYCNRHDWPDYIDNWSVFIE